MSWTTMLALPALALVGFELIVHRLPDARVRLAQEKLEDLRIDYPDEQHARLRFTVPFRNLGNQQGLIIDAEARLQPSGLRYSDLQPVVRLSDPARPRQDGYWEACIVPAGAEMPVEVEIWLTAPRGARQAVAELGEFRVDLFYKFYCRTPMQYRREEIVLHTEDFREVPAGEGPVVPIEPTPRPLPPDSPVLPLRTHLLRPGEDVVEVTARYLEGVARPGDMVALAESAVAIMQGRLAYCEDIHPRYLARRLNRIFGMDASLSSVYALEMAFREAGTCRILLATAAAFIGRLLGRSGDFYRVAGRRVTVIDDCTGTLPPFDKHVVLAPLRPQQVVEEIRRRTGIDATIVDANDLGKVDILAISDPTRQAEVEEALRPNPQGNAGEMTPLALIHGRAQAEEA
ncbi:MAG: hypothetical protein GX934_12230 [Burkholderiales bacterium]|nr:hypothetical protein [Burkholderiales bacterium]